MDWKSVVAELQGFGLTQPQIAAVCGCRQTTISALATGKTADPSHSLGEALRQLLERRRDEKARAADADRRDQAAANPFPDLDRRAPAAAVEGEGA